MTMQVHPSTLTTFVQRGITSLAQQDPVLYTAFEAEYQRQAESLILVASSSLADPSVLACENMLAVNVTAEGYPGKRFHAGCVNVDVLEELAIERAQLAFNAVYANVQPHSASSANEIVMAALLRPGDTILGMELQYGGHLSHGAKASFSGQYFNAIGYGLGKNELIDYEEVAQLAHEHHPKLIICGASAYSRTIDFRRFRQIADEVGALLLADISHTAGIIIAGLHPSPINEAHVTTTCTHKQLFGPRGGLIMMGKDADMLGPDGKHTLRELLQKGVFPFFQGAPQLNTIAAKARCLAIAMQPTFKMAMQRVVDDARVLADCFMDMGYRVISSGTDNHIVLVDVTSQNNITGFIAEKVLEDCGIIVNKNRIAGDTRGVFVTSGIRIGTNTVAMRNMGPRQMQYCAELIHKVLSQTQATGDRSYSLDEETRTTTQARVRALCRQFPIPNYQ
jgi:glycine hydroxymethyltransferase